jgi:hypothetical protein
VLSLVNYISLMKSPGDPEAHGRMPARVFRMGAEPRDDMRATTTAGERLAMVALLSTRMWRLTGRPIPSYGRADMPGRVIRPGG